MTERDTRGTTGERIADSAESSRAGERAVSRRTVLKGGAVGAIAAAVGARAMPSGNDGGGDDDSGGLDDGDSGDLGDEDESQETDPYADYEGDSPPPIDGTDPTDPDGDGLYEDVNGDGETSEADAERFADRRNDPVVDSFPEYYDFSGNGEIDSADTVQLYQEVSE